MTKYWKVAEADKAELDELQEAITSFGSQTMASMGYKIAVDEDGNQLGVVGKRNGKDDYSSLTKIYSPVITEEGFCYLLHIDDPSLTYSQEYRDYINENLVDENIEVVEL